MYTLDFFCWCVIRVCVVVVAPVQASGLPSRGANNTPFFSPITAESFPAPREAHYTAGFSAPLQSAPPIPAQGQF